MATFIIFMYDGKRYLLNWFDKLSLLMLPVDAAIICYLFNNVNSMFSE